MGMSGRWVGSVRGRVCGGFSGTWCWGWVSTRGMWVELGSMGGVVGYVWGQNAVGVCGGKRSG